TVTARDAYGNVAAGYRGTVHFTGTGAELFAYETWVLPGDYAFVEADQGAHSFSAVANAAGDDVLIATDTVTETISGFQSIGILPGPTTALKVVNLSRDGSPILGQIVTTTAEVQAEDLYGNLAFQDNGEADLQVTRKGADQAVTLDQFVLDGQLEGGKHTFS